MNIQPNSKQSISDDQELAKVLAGVGDQGQPDAPQGEANQPEPTLPPVPPQPAEEPANQPPQPPAEEAPSTPPVPPEPAPEPSEPIPQPSTPSGNSDLDGIKQQALGELRPLVDKLEVDPEEKFDTYLLLLRSTDDKELIAPAHEAAKAITDESRRAQALLNIIKEIDFLSGSSTNNPAS